MLRKLLPVVLLVLGAAAGAGAGMFLRPAATEVSTGATVVKKDAPMSFVAEKSKKPVSDYEYVKLNNQFVVPVVNGDRISALVVLSLSLEVPAGSKEAVYAKEPKLRDSFLQVLFDHANIGGFDGAFTNANNLAVLRNALQEVAQKDVGDNVSDVLIVEIAKQNY